jgi:hypothetical protein
MKRPAASLQVFIVAASFAGLTPCLVSALDVSGATVFVPSPTRRAQPKAIELLLDEIDKRTGIRWTLSETWPTDGTPVQTSVSKSIWQLPSIAARRSTRSITP